MKKGRYLLLILAKLTMASVAAPARVECLHRKVARYFSTFPLLTLSSRSLHAALISSQSLGVSTLVAMSMMSALLVALILLSGKLSRICHRGFHNACPFLALCECREHDQPQLSCDASQ